MDIVAPSSLGPQSGRWCESTAAAECTGASFLLFWGCLWSAPLPRPPHGGLAAGSFTLVLAAGHVAGCVRAYVALFIVDDASLACYLLTFWLVFDGLLQFGALW